MKKLFILLGVIASIFLIKFAVVNAATLLFPQGGGTGIGSATAGDVGDCLSVSDDSPFTYSFSACAGGTGGSGTISTSTTIATGTLAYFNGLSTIASVATGTLTTTATGLEFDNTRGVVGGASILSLTAGYQIPTTTRMATWDAKGNGTVTSVDMSVPTGLSISGNPITTSGTLALGLTAGYNIPLTASSTNWNTAYGWGNHATAGYDQVTTAGDGLTRTVNDFDCDTASGSVFGCLSAANWTTFNGKQDTITAGDALTLTGTDIDFDGGATPSGDLGGTWASPSVTDDSHAHTASTISGLGTADISGIDISDDTNLTGGVGLTLTNDDMFCDLASGSVFGCLASADWTIFNNKVSSTSIDTSAELDALVGDDTGSGALVFATSPSIVSPTISTFFGTPCTGNQFLQDISDTGAFTCVTATGGSSFTVTSTTTPSWRSTLQGWTFPDGQKMNEDIENNYFNTIKPIWYQVEASGAQTLRDSGTYGTFGYNASNTELIRENSTEQFVTSSGSDPDIHVLTASPTLSATAIAQMVGFATSSHFTGIELDWEGFNSWTATETANYFAFVDKLSKSAHANGLKTMIYVPPIWNTAANRESGSGDEWDSANSSSYYNLTYDMVNKSSADYIVIPAYDYQFDYSNDRPNAPLKWMQDIANFAKSKITDHDRLIMGIPSAGFYGATGGYSSTGLTYDDATVITGYSGRTRDTESGEEHWVNGGNQYWICDDTCIETKRTRAESLGITRISLWHIGENRYGSSKIEPTIANQPDRLSINDLSSTVPTDGYVLSASTTAPWGMEWISAGAGHAAVTLSGAYDYITLVGQDIVRGLIDLATDVTGTLAVANGGTGATSLTNLITLATHTVGNYIATITGTANKVDVSGSGSENAGVTITLSDTLDLGGNTSFEIPNGTNPTVDTVGEIGLDTTDNQLLIGSAPYVIQTQNVKIWSVTIASTSPAFISGGLLKVPTQLDGYTMTAIRCSVQSGTSKVIAVEDESTNSTEDITCATSVTSDDGSITNATATAAEEMYIDFGATTGTVDYVSISVFGNWTRE